MLRIITNSEEIRKVRYVDERYNQMVVRVDENDTCKRINIDEYDLSFDYDVVVISDYCKGFLQEEDINEITTIFECPIFLDTKKQLGPWCKNISFIKINHLEHLKNFEKSSELSKTRRKNNSYKRKRRV